MTTQATMGRRERKKLERRELILLCSRDLFDRHGFEGVSVETIAEAADVSLRTLYNFFPTKLDLFTSGIFSVVQARLNEARAALIDPPLSPVEGLNLWFKLHMDVYTSLERDLILRGLLHAWTQGNEHGGGQDYAKVLHLTVAEVRELLAVYVARGTLPNDVDVEALASLIFAAGNGEFFRWIADRDPVEAACGRMHAHIGLAVEGALRGCAA
ncbi:MAG: TetR/AcrR family transcriptional regulator [Phenylobacterium sp.]